ncbi:hypothetical protein BOTBODRAFT_148608 [Botryobasidium botryosum FD-172 SS1]|uniref:protein-tyrosine-phosphatase n=1 Tax=Botryobasidium botryosum (strain FD-172 SS1) TaxID=930990 RepID=A0A067M1P6_BOTB1|nr:hypothetical protein BOTBODRAFT_148608 [Botryobasidium botryosum FD-172 SS1]
MDEASEYHTMDQIIPNLWVGDFEAALDTELLEKHGIKHVLSAVRGIRVDKKFIRHECDLLDTEYSDLFTFLPRAVSFIENALEKSEGVLVHCHAGMSRSASIAAAYLMKSQDMDVATAVNLMKKARPIVQPNKGFLHQLEIFRSASYRVYPSYKPARKYFMKRTVIDISGPNPTGGSKSSKMTIGMSSSRSGTAVGSSTEPTPSSGAASMMDWRRIRCRKCRNELALRKDILQHGKTLIASGGTTMASPLFSGFVTSLAKELGVDGGVAGTKLTIDEMEQTGVSGLAEGSATAVTSLITAEGSKMTSGDDPDARRAETEDPSASTGPRDLSPPSTLAPLVTGTAPAPTPSAQYFLAGKIRAAQANAPPLISPECSGYFLEPMAWMRPFIEKGKPSGKIMCPNRKCSVKLGNFDWAGVRCGCEEWIAPWLKRGNMWVSSRFVVQGFCLHRSKVDEIWN